MLMGSDWEITQDRQLIDFKKGADVFSLKEKKGAIVVGELLNSLVPDKTCLDVGCGILPLPRYMEVATQVKFTGIDPFDAEGRQFTFIKGLIEDIQIENESFDAILFATSFDHVRYPEKAINQVYRILKNSGYLIIWGSFRNEYDSKYKLWIKTRSLSIYNHPWVFTLNTIHKLLQNRFTLIKVVNIVNAEKVLIYQK